MARNPDIVAGLAWFRVDQWPLLRALAADANHLEQTHEEWVRIAEKTIVDLARQGVSLLKIDVDVNELQAWCAARGRPLDGSARAQYAAARVRDAHENA